MAWVSWIVARLKDGWTILASLVVLIVIVMFCYIKLLKSKLKSIENIKDFNNRNEVVRKATESIAKAKEEYYEAVHRKTVEQKKDLDKHNPTKWGWVIVIPFLLTNCQTRIIYEYIHVKDEIPLMMKYQKPVLEDVVTEPVNDNGFVCVEYNTLNRIYRHVQELREIIGWYEHDIDSYMRFREVYNRRN